MQARQPRLRWDRTRAESRGSLGGRCCRASAGGAGEAGPRMAARLLVKAAAAIADVAKAVLRRAGEAGAAGRRAPAGRSRSYRSGCCQSRTPAAARGPGSWPGSAHCRRRKSLGRGASRPGHPRPARGWWCAARARPAMPAPAAPPAVPGALPRPASLRLRPERPAACLRAGQWRHAQAAHAACWPRRRAPTFQQRWWLVSGRCQVVPPPACWLCSLSPASVRSVPSQQAVRRRLAQRQAGASPRPPPAPTTHPLTRGVEPGALGACSHQVQHAPPSPSLECLASLLPSAPRRRTPPAEDYDQARGVGPTSNDYFYSRNAAQTLYFWGKDALSKLSVRAPETLYTKMLTSRFSCILRRDGRYSCKVNASHPPRPEVAQQLIRAAIDA